MRGAMPLALLISLELTKDFPVFLVHPSELIGISVFFIELLSLLLFRGKMTQNHK